MTRWFAIALLTSVLADGASREETAEYLRLLPAGKTARECHFTLNSSDDGRSIVSVTGRGAVKMTVSARYDAGNRLVSAEARLAKGNDEKKARVEVKDGKALVKRDGHEAQEFDVPANVIVTSAPDWSDTFLLCRSFDRAKGGKQEFAALWIHPEQPARRLTFSIERQGTDTIEHAGKKLKLDRHLIRIRNNSEYVAWSDDQGRMIQLMSRPAKAQGGTTLVRAGFEKSVADLKNRD